MKKIISISLIVCFLMLNALNSLAEDSADVITSVTVISCTSNGDGTQNIEIQVSVTSGDIPLTNQNVTLMLIGTENNGIGEQIDFVYDNIQKSGYIYYLAQGNTEETNTYTFSFPLTIPKAAVNAEYIYVLSGCTDSELTGEAVIPIPVHNIDFIVGDHGKITYSEEILTSGSKVPVVDGYTINIDIEPDAGYVIDRILWNEADISIDMLAENYQTGRITKDSTLDILFKLDERETTITTFPETFVANNNSITFGTISHYNLSEEIVEYGIVYSKTEEVPEIDKENCKTYKADTEKHPKNSKGQYGICLIGEAKYLGNIYYARPYVIIKDENNNQTVLYGETMVVELDINQ